MKKDTAITFRTHDAIKRELVSTASALGTSVSWVINQKLLEMLPDHIKAIIEPTIPKKEDK